MKFQAENVGKFKDLSDKIKDTLAVEGNAIKETEPHSAYYANLPEGTTKDTVDSLSKYNSKFVTASHVAIGELAADVLGKNKNIDTVSAEIGFFGKNDSISVTVNREKTYNNFLAKGDADKEITKHLVMNTVVTLSSAKGTSLKAVKESMGEEFHNKFKA